MWTKYYNVSAISEAIELLSSAPQESKIIAGGTDLVLEIERDQRKKIKTLIDISRVEGLDKIEIQDDGKIHLGPMVTHNDCINSPIIRKNAIPLAQACWNIGSPQIRNRGTIGGNLITASPANDTIPALMVLDAYLSFQSTRGIRNIPIRDFYLGVRKTVMQEDEILVDISFQSLNNNERGVFFKQALRKAQAISLVNLSILIEAEDSIIKKVRLALGAVAPTVIRAFNVEKFLEGKFYDLQLIDDVLSIINTDASPITDIRSSTAYRSEMLQVLLRKSLTHCLKENPESMLPEKPILLWGKPEGKKDKSYSSEHVNDKPIETTINGKHFIFRSSNQKTLLDMIREDANLTGTKEGCGEGECGACTIHMDGKSVMSCLIPAPRAHGSEISTIEGISLEGNLHPIQESFIEKGAVQCGYCTPGFIMSAVSMIEENPKPTTEQIKQGFSGNLCRCTGYYKIIEAVESVIEKMR